MAKANVAGWTPYVGLGRWHPPSAHRMGEIMNAESRQMLGISILSAISIAGLHSAVCPSYFTMKTFASQPEARTRAMEGLWISLGLSTVTSGALYFIFDNWLPTIVAQATALALFGIGVYAIHSQPPETIPPIEKQEQVRPQAVAAG